MKRQKQIQRTSQIHAAFSMFFAEIAYVIDRRRCEHELPELPFHLDDAIHHLETVIDDLALVERDDMQAPSAQLGALSEATAVLTREAFLAVLAIAEDLDCEVASADPQQVERGKRATAAMLDALSPYVSRHEIQLRQIVIDDVAPEVIDNDVCTAS